MLSVVLFGRVVVLFGRVVVLFGRVVVLFGRAVVLFGRAVAGFDAGTSASGWMFAVWVEAGTGVGAAFRVGAGVALGIDVLETVGAELVLTGTALRCPLDAFCTSHADTAMTPTIINAANCAFLQRSR